jgi:hypothetical protein
MHIVDKNTFFKIVEKFKLVPFTQTEGWWTMNSTENENRFAFFVDSIENPRMAAMGHIKKALGLTMLQIGGECFADENAINDKIIREFYREIAQCSYDIIEINSSLPYNALYEIGIRQAGYLRPVGLFSTALSILVDLKKTIEYDKNWQKNLRRANKYLLDFIPVNRSTEKDINDYVAMHSEMLTRKKIHDGVSHKGLQKLLQDKKFSIFFVETAEKKRIAGLILYANHDAAISVFSTTSLEGREKSAAYFLFDKTFAYVADSRILHYDCGRISPSAHSKNNIFLFKNGVKGNYVQYCGEFSYYKRRFYRPLMYFVKKYLFKRVEL